MVVVEVAVMGVVNNAQTHLSAPYPPPVVLAPSVSGTHGKEYMRTDSYRE